MAAEESVAPINAMKDLDLSNVSPLHDTNETQSNPLEKCRRVLAELLSGMLEDCTVDNAYTCLQYPSDTYNGDFSLTIPKLCPGCKPQEVSTELINQFPREHALFLPPLPDGVHLRIFLQPNIVPRLLLPLILARKQDFGAVRSAGDRQRVVVEFSSPNITNEFEGKHLRSTIVGSFVGRLYDSIGWDVTRLNYLGDWGQRVALLYVGWKKFGSDEALQSDPVKHLLEVYHKIEEEFKPEQAASKQARDELAKEGKDEGEAQVTIETQGIFAERNDAAKKLEGGDEELMAFWARTRACVVDDYEKFYERLGIRFDDYSGESDVKAETMIEIEQLLKEKGVSEESAGAWMVDMKKLGARTGHAIIRNRNGNTTYILRDLAAVYERSRKYSFDKMIYVVANDTHTAHFIQLVKIVEALDKDLAKKLRHVKFNDSSKMSATLGLNYKPQTILDQCEEAMKIIADVDEEKIVVIGKPNTITKALSISALLVQELSTRFGSVHAFDTTTLASFKLGSGPDLQYCYSKIRSLLANQDSNVELSDDDFDALSDDDQANLVRILAQYPQIIDATLVPLEPSGLAIYLASVVDQLSECLNEEEGPVDVTAGLAALLEATRIVLANGMTLMGLVPIADSLQERADTPIEA